MTIPVALVICTALFCANHLAQALLRRREYLIERYNREGF